MLPKKYRLTAVEFYQNPQKSRKLNSFFGAFYFKSAGAGLPRFVIVVPSFLDKRAVYRHRTKRIIIEAIRKYLPNLKKNAEVLIKVGRILNKQDRLQVEKETQKILKEIGLL